MQPWQAGLAAAAAQHHRQAMRGEPALQTDPEPGKVGVLVAGADSKVVLQGLTGLVPERQRPLAATLAEHQQQHDDRGVTAGLEAPAGAGGQQPPRAVGGG
jgi:hypothetical protein